jgi:hypothetical protein
MSRVAENIISMIDKGHDILDIAKIFGDVNGLLNVVKKYPYLQAMVMTKLGGTLYISAEDENGDMIPFNLNFVIIDLEEVGDGEHYDALVDIVIPELTEGKETQMLFTWLGVYLQDLGSEVAAFNDEKLNKKHIWIYAKTINGEEFNSFEKDVLSDEEVLKIIPDNYKEY